MSGNERRNAYMRAWCRAHRGAENARHRKYRKQPEVRSKNRTYLKNYRSRNPGRDAVYSKDQRLKLMEETFGVYGPCTCCGEANVLFLTIDHVNNDGARQRRGIGDGPGGTAGTKGRAGVHFYRWLKKNNWPRDGYRSMCFNCNCGRARNGGVCPHMAPLRSR